MMPNRVQEALKYCAPVRPGTLVTTTSFTGRPTRQLDDQEACIILDMPKYGADSGTARQNSTPSSGCNEMCASRVAHLQVQITADLVTIEDSGVAAH